MSKRRKRLVIVLSSIPAFIILWLLGVFLLQLYWNRLTIGRDTTFVTGPLRDGTIDYYAAVNDHFRQGVTPENNAEVLLARLRPANSYEPGVRDEVWKLLGTAPPADTPAPMDKALSDRFREHAQAAWTAKDDPEAAAWLDAHEAEMKILTLASLRDHYWYPLVRKPSEMTLLGADYDTLRSYHDFENALVARATRRWVEEDYKGFRDDILAVHRLGVLLSHGPSVMHRLQGVGFIKSACRAADVAAVSKRLTADQAHEILSMTRALPPIPEIAEAIDWDERCGALDVVTQFSRHRIEPTNRMSLAFPVRPLAIHFDSILQTVNSYFDRLVAIESLPPWEIKAAEDKFESDMDREANVGFWVFGMGTTSARGWAMGFVPNLCRAYQLRCACLEEQRLTHVALVLAAWHADHGSYPDSLASLPADELKGDEKDLFSKEADLHYRLDGADYVLYSIGMNIVDDGGHGTEYKNPKGDDIVIRSAPLGVDASRPH